MSFTDFKEVTSNNTGSTTRYGGNDLKELMQVLNGKTVSNRQIRIKNPIQFLDNFDMRPPVSAPASPADSNTSRIYVDPSDFKVKIKKTGGTVMDLENVNIPDSALSQISNKAKLPSTLVYKDQNNDMGDFYMDFGDISAPANPSAGVRRIFTNTATGELSVKTSAGTTVSLEGAGGGGGNVSTTQANTYGDFDQIFRSGRLDVMNPANTFAYSVTGSAIAAARTLTLPLLTGNDTVVTEAFAQTLTNKTIAAGSNTISGIADAHIATHTTSKISTTSKALLNTAIVYNDQNTDLGAFYQDMAQIATPANPPAGDRRIFVDSTNTHLSVRTSAGGTVDLESSVLPDLETGGQSFGLWSGGAKQGTGLFSAANVGTGTMTAFQSSATGDKVVTNIATSTTISQHAGFWGSAAAGTCRNQNFRFKCKFQVDTLTDKRFAIGLAAVATLPTGVDAFLATAVAGFLFRYSSTTDTTLQLLRNDAAGTAVTVNTGITLAANTNVTIEIVADEANSRMGWAINGGAFTYYTTDIPLANTYLNYHAAIQTKTTSTIVNLRIYYAYLTQAGA